MKHVEAHFTFYSKEGKILWNNPQQVEGYARQHEGSEILCIMSPVANIPEKQRMNRYLHGPLLSCAMKAFHDAGYEGIDKVVAMYKLKSEFAKDYILNKNTGQMEPYLLEIGSMTKDRMLKFICDCIHFLEAEFSQIVPDSVEYKQKLKSGIAFRRKK